METLWDRLEAATQVGVSPVDWDVLVPLLADVLARGRRLDTALATIRNKTIMWSRDSENKSVLLQEINHIAQEGLTPWNI